MSAPVHAIHWRRLPLRALLLLIWPVLYKHWKWVVGGTLGGGWHYAGRWAQGHSPWPVVLWSVLGLLAVGAVRWWNTRVSISNQGVRLRHGGFSRDEAVLPFERIAGLQAEQTLMLRALGLYQVVLESSASEHGKMVLPAVTQDMLGELRAHMQRGGRVHADTHAGAQATAHLHPDAPGRPAQDGVVATEAGNPGQLIHALNRGETMRMSLTSIQTLFIGPLLIAVFNRSHDGFAHAKLWQPMIGFLHRYLGPGDSVLSWGLFLLLALAACVLLSLAWGAWRFGAFRLQEKAHEWHQVRGLITPIQQTLSPMRVAALIWKQNALQNRFGRGWLRVSLLGEGACSGGEGHDDDEHHEPKARPFLVPWLSYRRALRLQQRLLTLRPGVMAKGARYQALAPGFVAFYRRKFVLLPMVTMVLVLLNGASSARVWGGFALLGLAWVVAAEWLMRRCYERWRFAVSEHALRLQYGCFGYTRMMLPWSTVQSVRMVQSWYERRKQLAHIELINPSGKVKIPCLPLADAQILFDFVASRTILPEPVAALRQVAA